MPLRTFDTDDDLEMLRGEVVYTLGKCEGHKLAQKHVAACAGNLDGWQLVFGKHLSLRDKIARADSRVDGCDDELDAFVDEVATTLLLLNNNDRSAAEYRQYMGSKPPSEIKRPILGQELETVRGWIAPLKASPNALLGALGARGEALVSEADAAVKALATAQQEYRAFRLTGEYSQLVEKLNADRKSIYGELSKLPHEPQGKGLPGDFADRFFRHETRRNKKYTVDSVRKQITALEGQLDNLRATLEELEKKEAAKRDANTEREALEAQLAEAEKLRAEADKQAAEIKAKLKK
jgi:predicted phage tail protein